MRKFARHLVRKAERVKPPKFSKMVVLLTLFISVILALTFIIVMLVMLILSALHVIELPEYSNFAVPTFVWIIACLVIGVMTTALVSHVPLRPLQRLMDGMNRLAQGDYSTRLTDHHSSIGARIADSFNTLAMELENTEMLRADFVNNFSHEFKTPIVSILGFAKLLKRADLPPEKREEYLDIILSEATRLTDMSENALNLAKIEKQAILTDVKSFNLSEQIRTCILLLQKKWEGKQQEIAFDEYEYHCLGNEEMLKQVWINLLDNAIKFTQEGGCIRVTMQQHQDALSVSVFSPGEPVDQRIRKRIFEKFYQGDTSHATEGTGLGLAIVQRIVQLHKGTVAASYQDDCNVFTVTLPQTKELPKS